MKRICLVLMSIMIGLCCANIAFAGEAGFSDVSDSHWAKNEIAEFANRNIVNGFNDGSFHPNNGVTREEFCKMLVLTFGAQLKDDNSSFLDVKESRWSKPYIETCRDYMTGYSNPMGGLPLFHPSEDASREDIAVALVKMMGLSGKDAMDPEYALRYFNDGNSISPAIVPYVSVACEQGLISGYQDRTFRPNKNVTRAETVVLLNRATKRAVSDISEEIPLKAEIVDEYIDYKGIKTGTILVQSEPGVNVTVNGKELEMEGLLHGYKEVRYEFELKVDEEKEFVVNATRGNQNKSINFSVSNIPEKPEIYTTGIQEKTSNQRLDFYVKCKNNQQIECQVKANGKDVYRFDNEHFRIEALRPGDNLIEITATNEFGKTTYLQKTVTFIEDGPRIYVTECPSKTDEEIARIAGRIEDDNFTGQYLKFYIDDTNIFNQQAYHGYSDGKWWAKLQLDEGINTFTLKAINPNGAETEKIVQIECKIGTPEIVILNCPETSESQYLTIKGRIKGQNEGSTVYINDEEVGTDYYCNFSKKVTLSEGNNRFKIRVVNKYGKTSVTTCNVFYSSFVEDTEEEIVDDTEGNMIDEAVDKIE